MVRPNPRIIIEGDSRGAENALRRTRDAARRTTDVIRSFGRFAAQSIKLFAVGVAGLVAGLGKYEERMAGVKAVTGATADEMEKLDKRARDLGGTTQFTASQVAEGMKFLAQAGLSVSQVLEAIEPNLRLARAGMIDLGRAAQFTSSIMNQYGLAATDITHITDILAKVATDSSTDVSKLALSFSYVGGIAEVAKISLEETGAALNAMAKAGISAEKAGTGLRGMIAQLLNPSKNAINILGALGLKVGDVDIAARGLIPVIQTLADKNISASEAFILFGRESVTSGIALLKNADNLEKLTNELVVADDAAQNMAATMGDTLLGDLKIVISALQEFGLTLLHDVGLNDRLRNAAQSVSAAIRKLTKFVKDNTEAFMLVVDWGWRFVRVMGALFVVSKVIILVRSLIVLLRVGLVSAFRVAGVAARLMWAGATLGLSLLLGFLPELLDWLNKKIPNGINILQAAFDIFGNSVSFIFKTLAGTVVKLGSAIYKVYDLAVQLANAVGLVGDKYSEGVTETYKDLNKLGSDLLSGAVRNLKATGQAVKKTISEAYNYDRKPPPAPAAMAQAEGPEYVDPLIKLAEDQKRIDEFWRNAEASRAAPREESDEQAAVEEQKLAKEQERQEKKIERKEEVDLRELEQALKHQEGLVGVAERAMKQKIRIYDREQKEKARLQKKANDLQAKMERDKSRARHELYQAGSNALLYLLKSEGKKQNIAYKAVAIGKILIDTYTAASQAFSKATAMFFPYGVAIGAAVAALITAAGLKSAAKVAGFAEGGIVPGARGAVDTVPAMLSPGELVVPSKRVAETFDAIRDQKGTGRDDQEEANLHVNVFLGEEKITEIVERVLLSR